MKTRIQLTLSVALLLAMSTHHASAQSPVPIQAYGGYSPYGAYPAMFNQGPVGAPPAYTPHGLPFPGGMISPAGYSEGAQPAPGEFGPGVQPMPNASFSGEEGDYFDGHGYEEDCDCDECRGGGRGKDHLAKIFGCLSAPCQAHWFDIHAEYMEMKRDEVSDTVNFTSDGVTDTNIVLSSDDLDFEDREKGFRVTSSMVLTAGYDIEMSYFGIFDWSSYAQVTSDSNSLFSPLSDFGQNPNQGFVETDQASLHSIQYDSRIHNAEINFRRRWSSEGSKVQGSWLWGVRYVRLEELLLYHTESEAHVDPVLGGNRGPGFMDYRVEMQNDLVGVQTGGDLYVCLFPGFMIGVEAEGGVYGNRAKNGAHVTATSLTDPVVESARESDFALVGEASAIALIKLSKNARFRTSYQAMIVEGVGLATENFNSASPFSARDTFIDTNSQVFYHGFTAGLEWIW